MKNDIKHIVSKDNILHNFNTIKAINPKAKFCAVVKADAYGVGAKTVVKTLIGKVDFFAVSNAIEAKEVRGIDNITTILILMPIETKYARFCSKNNISITVQNSLELAKLARLNIPLNVHIKINTGLNRFGEKSTADFMKIQQIFLENENLKFEGIFTHFASSDSDNEEYYEMQYKNFKNYLDLIYPEFKPIRHCSNSAATIKSGEKVLDMVRVGIALHGYNPIDKTKKLDLKPVVKITTKIASIFTVSKGEYIGYNMTFKAERCLKIATIRIGYADGYKRAYSNKTRVIINGHYCNVVGNVSMDSTMVDITDAGNLKLNSEVIVLGECGDKRITIEELAKLANTSPYEILCNLKTKRIEYINK